MSDEDKALVDRLRELERDLKPFAHKTVGSIRIDLNEVRAIVGCPDRIIALEAEIEKLREALKDLLDLDQRCGWHSKQADAARAALGETK